MRFRLLPMLVLLPLACGDLKSTGQAESGEGTDATGATETTDGTQSTGPDESTGSAESGPETAGPSEALLLRTEFEIPAGTTVLEFAWEAEGIDPPFPTDGADVLVSVLDLTHPRRDQSELCPTNHPLDGCATVDYGAFGDTHDNRLGITGSSGPVELHLHKDRSVQALAEPLPPNE